ncbi:MAG: His/Glu/Gln/Arg/opine family amino acid ABC transporter permease subunit [Paracoccaceae bacterium]|jgi:His/Glu/Gln/Arg/opine family amino acid ABC transporter permease subunit
MRRPTPSVPGMTGVGRALLARLSPRRAPPATAMLALAALSALAGCSANGASTSWGWYVVSPFTEQGRTNLGFLIGGLGDTLLLSATAMAISVVLGLLVAIPAITVNRWGRAFNLGYVEVVRAAPILVLILWVYYGLPVVAGIAINVFWAGVLALALSDSAFEAEIFRSGIQGVDKGQTEAARTLGLSWFQSMRLIVLPQALRLILPPLANQFAYMIKMSALVSVIGMQELTRRANELVVTEYRPLEIYTVLLLEYLVLILAVSQAVRWFERRLKRRR